ncbi:MAG: signal recognition particle-docking protein FtsY [Candidatus Geothermincolia bacterium]
MAKGKKRLKEPKERRRDRKEREAAERSAEETGAGPVVEGVAAPGGVPPWVMEQEEPVLEPAEEPEAPPEVVEPEVTPEPEEIPLELTGEFVAEEEEPEDLAEALEGEEGDEGEKKRLRKGMFRSRRVLSRPFVRAATRKAIDPEFWVEAEEALIAADAGVACSTAIVEGARKRILSEGIRDIEGLKEAFRDEVAGTLRSFGVRPELPEKRPHVIFVVGVNGVGKTTTTAKIGNLYKENGYKVLFAAADTFRAAGIEQMEMWAHRVGAPVVRHKTGGDPAAVVFDALESATAREMDIVLVDTAGRLHTKKNLMDELNKMWRVAERQMGVEPESILAIDATTGQNGVTQARIFGEALPIGSIALTKMDGSAKGGVVLAIGSELGIPVAYIGVGEGLADLRPFDPDSYARALF